MSNSSNAIQPVHGEKFIKGKQPGTNSSHAPGIPISSTSTHHSMTSMPMGHSGWLMASVIPPTTLTTASSTHAAREGVKAYTNTSTQGGCPKKA